MGVSEVETGLVCFSDGSNLKGAAVGRIQTARERISERSDWKQEAAGLSEQLAREKNSPEDFKVLEMP